MIDVRDSGDFAATVLRAPAQHKGCTYTLTGSASLSLRDAAAELGEVYGTPIAYQPVTPDDAQRSMVDAGLSAWMAAVNKEYLTAYSEGWGDYTTPDFEKVMGRPARSFADFARAHAPQIRP
ncbi:hypothetical protein ACIBQ1_47540 [Nonomuraea sp. NPDC050153]|uniref:hypothetical protein n=1 Tax=Nonomuraea sp. NPDC050153 TaxID=3364359 RepID=UPI0037890609